MLPEFIPVETPDAQETTTLDPQEKFYSRVNSLYGEHTEDVLAALSEHYTFTPKSLYAISESKDGQKLILVTYTPVFITELYKDEDNSPYVQLEAFVGKDWVKLPIVPIETIANVSKITALAKKGLNVTSVNQRALIAYLSHLLYLVRDLLPGKTLLKSYGWHNEHFYLPSIADDTVQFLHTGSDSFKALKAAKGDLGAWCEAYKRLMADSMVARFLMACSFAAPLVKRLGYNGNPLIYLYGKRGYGKTTILNMAASIWGSEKLISSFDGTRNGFEIFASQSGNLPCLLDDAQLMRSLKNYDTFMQDIIYKFFSGKGKLRANDDIQMRPLNQWQTFIIFNGETPLTSSEYYGGARRRIVEIELTQPFSHADISYYSNISKANYGWAGPIFLELLERISPDQLRTLFEQLCDKLFKLDQGRHENTLISILAMVGIAEAIAHASLFHAEDPLNTLQQTALESADMVITILSTLDSNDEKDAAHSYYETIMQTVDMHLANFDKLNVENNTYQFSTSNMSYGFLYKGDVYINPEIFKKVFMQHFALDYRSILQTLRDNQLLKCNPHRLQKLANFKFGKQYYGWYICLPYKIEGSAEAISTN